MRPRVLYISYDGMLEPLGQSQVLAYQEHLSNSFDIHLISFEKPADLANTQSMRLLKQRIAKAGIHWHPCVYHKRPSALATAFDIAVATLHGYWLIKRHRLSIVHARSYVSAVAALVLKRLTGVSFIFDMRGFWADERVDGGLWPKNGRMYRLSKWFERQFLLNADHVVSLTEAAVQVMRGFDYLQSKQPVFTVIPTCADLDRFKPSLVLNPKDPFVLGYVGSAGTWYLFDKVAACFSQLLQIKPEARFLIINRGEHDYILKHLLSASLPIGSFEIKAANHSEVPGLMAKMHAGVFFVKPAFSKQASAPTKLAEFLGCGIPCLSNSKVGDMEKVLKADNVGVVLDSFDDTAMANGLDELIQLASQPDTAARCVESAKRHFSLDEGVRRYSSIYSTIALQSTKA